MCGGGGGGGWVGGCLGERHICPLCEAILPLPAPVQVCHSLPKNVGFNVDVKYPTPNAVSIISMWVYMCIYTGILCWYMYGYLCGYNTCVCVFIRVFMWVYMYTFYRYLCGYMHIFPNFRHLYFSMLDQTGSSCTQILAIKVVFANS